MTAVKASVDTGTINRKKYVYMTIAYTDEKDAPALVRFEFVYTKDNYQLADSLSSSFLTIKNMLNDGRLKFSDGLD